MHPNIYYDWFRKEVLSERDGCRYEDWGNESDKYSFALHPKGFPVFISPSELKNSDEYSRGDPYTVETNIGNAFHKRRIDSTIYLLNLVLDKNIPKRILDIGCGQGYLTAEIQKNFPEAEIAGLDYSVSAISNATDKFRGIDFCVADAFNPPYRNDYFDAVVCNNLWEHVPNPVLLLSVIKRILKSGGFLIISTPSRYRFSNIFRVLRGKPTTLISAHHVTEYSVGQVIDQINWGGFKIRKVYSKPVYDFSNGIKYIIPYRIILPIMRNYLKFMNSHHSLESTVFFMAEKR